MGSGALVEARGPAGPDSRFETSGPRVWFEVGPRGDITVHYRTPRGESEPKPQCFKTLISHLRGFESGAKVA